ncbi:MAG: class I SAM-dependent methyltransferase, partial [Candidatus Berkiellales bacterium]
MYQKLCTEFYDNDKPLATAQEVNFYSQFFTKNQLILEPMCGTGRLLIPLLEAGFKVHGFDNSPYMLTNCKKRLSERNLYTEIFEASITEFHLPQLYDGIVIPFGSFQLLYPREIAYKALTKLHHHLKPKGKIMFDMYVPWEAMYQGGENEKTTKNTILPDGSSIVHTSFSKVNKYEQYMSSDNIYEKSVDGKVIAREEEQMDLCWYFLYEFELVLEKHGFKNINRIKKIIDQEELIVYIA